MVRLKAVSEIISISQNSFQFQNGAIKSLLTAFGINCTLQFQFQNGAIKSCLKRQKALLIAMFQFQNGAIKRNCTSRTD